MSATLAVYGRQTIGVNQAPTAWGNDFPFAMPSVDIQRLLGDFYLAYEDPLCQFALPLSVAWLYGFGANVVAPPSGFPSPAHAKDLVIHDANGNVVFDSTASVTYGETLWASRYLIIEWQSATAVCRCTMYLAWGPNDVPLVYDQYITPINGELDGRTYLRMPLRTRSFVVDNQVLAGNMQIGAGYNMLLTPVASVRRDGTRLVNRVTVDAVPGAGLGRAPGCEETQPILRRINRVTAQAGGNFIVDARDCLRAELALDVTGVRAEYHLPDQPDVVASSALQISDDCTPCCPCSAFVNVYKGLKNVWQLWADAAEKLEHIRDVYMENRDRWLEQRDCRLARLLKLFAQAEAGCIAALGASYCNASHCCLGEVEIRFTFQNYLSGALAAWSGAGVVEQAFLSGSETGGQDVPYDPMVEWPVVRFFFDFANPQSLSIAKLRLVVPNCTANESVRVTVSVHTGSPLANGDEFCALPVVDVPVDIQAIWTGLDLPAAPPTRVIEAKTLPLKVS